MASGLPVLGSRQAQAVDEMVADGAQGWVFDATSIDSIGQAIARCLDTPRERMREMGESARETALRFSPAHSASQILTACDQALAGRRRG